MNDIKNMNYEYEYELKFKFKIILDIICIQLFYFLQTFFKQCYFSTICFIDWYS